MHDLPAKLPPNAGAVIAKKRPRNLHRNRPPRILPTTLTSEAHGKRGEKVWRRPPSPHQPIFHLLQYRSAQCRLAQTCA